MISHKEAIDLMQDHQVTICEFCGKVKKELSFFIGASNQPDWCMVEGTGKMTCPDCYNKAQTEARERINGIIKE